MSYPVVDRRGSRSLDRKASLWDPMLSWLYGIGAHTYKGLHDRRVLPRRRATLPVVSVGSLTVGGSGKTPFVRWLATRLLAIGIKPAILSRGYGSVGGRQARVVDPTRPDALRDGDEPSLLARSLPTVPVVVGPNRLEAAALARSRGARVALLDDGFQHRKLARDLDIVLWDRTAERSQGRLLPRGALREPVSGLARAGAIVLVDRGDGFPERPSCPLPEERTFRARLAPFARQPLEVGTLVHALSGVADAASFEGSLQKLGLRLCGATRYPDHHVFTTREITDAARRAQGEGAHFLAVTAKDHTRWPRDSADELPTPAVFDLTVDVDPEESFLALLASVLGGSSCE